MSLVPETVYHISFERLEVYQVAKEFRRWVVRDLLPRIPRGEADSKDQIKRASKSITFNIAEGAEQETRPMARKHYRISKASSGECLAVLEDLEILEVPRLEPGFSLIRRIGAMLRNLAR
jgi:four helix bundle protein